jgi:alpha-D-ribose 1-methylphosphonate 5-triphosphate synthase subunit PhnH
MNSIDIEQNNRETFRVLLDVLSMPGKTKKLQKLFDSYTLSIASVLLYSEVSYCNTTKEEFHLIDAITNAKKDEIVEADYIFCDSIDGVLEKLKKGTYLSPEYSATVVYTIDSFDGINVALAGPGIDQKRIEQYPIDENFITEFNNNNKNYPLGNEIYFLNTNTGEIKALSRTTILEVA